MGQLAGDAELNDQVGILRRREIEARILLPFFEALTRQLGLDSALEVLHEVIDDAATVDGAAMRTRIAGEKDSASKDQFNLVAFSEQWGPWLMGGALEIEELSKEPDEWRFNVRRCRYAEMYGSLGMESLGVHMSCRRDARLLNGFSGDYVLERRQTIMEGAAYCDFYYHRRTEDESEHVTAAGSRAAEE